MPGLGPILPKQAAEDRREHAARFNRTQLGDAVLANLFGFSEGRFGHTQILGVCEVSEEYALISVRTPFPWVVHVYAPTIWTLPWSVLADLLGFSQPWAGHRATFGGHRNELSGKS